MFKTVNSETVVLQIAVVKQYSLTKSLYNRNAFCQSRIHIGHYIQLDVVALLWSWI